MKINKCSMNEIKNLIAEGTDLLVITSPPDSGENALLNRLELISESNWRISLTRANANSNIDSISQDIISQALPNKTKDALPLVSQIHKYLEHSANNGIVPLIIVEDAHQLSIETLTFILQLAELRYADSKFRIILVAGEAINEQLDDPELKDFSAGILRNIHIETVPIAKEKIEEHIKDYSLSSSEIDDFLLSDVDIEEDPKTNSSKPIFRLFIIIGIILIAIIYLYFSGQKNTEITNVESMVSTNPQQEMTTENPDETVLPAIRDQTINLEENDQESTDKNESNSNEEIPISTFESEPLIEEDTSKDMSDLEEKETVEVLEIPLIDIPAEIEEIEQPATEETGEKPIMEATDENTFNLETIPDFLTGIKGPNWIRQQPTEFYVLQIISAQYKSNLRNLLSGLPGIQEQLSGYVKYTPSGKPRYLLLYGIYPDEDAAKEAINELPTKLQSANPWPRIIDDVIKEIDTISMPLIEIEEGIEIPLGDFSGEIEEIEYSVTEETEEKSVVRATDENTFNLETIPDFLSGIKGPNWIRQQPTGSYVLQIISAQYKSNLRNLLSGLPGIQEQLSGYVKYTPSGKPRYLLLYGIYPDEGAAKEAIDELPTKLRSTNPWPRTVDDVIKEIDEISFRPPETDSLEGISGFG